MAISPTCPSVGQYGAAFRMVLSDLKVGPAREREVLKQFAELGFAISVAIAHAEDILPALALDPAYLFVVPGFDLWTDGVCRQKCHSRAVHRDGEPAGRKRAPRLRSSCLAVGSVLRQTKHGTRALTARCSTERRMWRPQRAWVR